MTVDPANNPLSRILFRKEGDPYFGRADTDSGPSKLSVLTLTVVVAALLLMPSVEDHRPVESFDRNSPLAGNSAPQRFDRPAATIAPLVCSECEHFLPKPTAAVETPAEVQSPAEAIAIDDWIPLLYPQLARIVELENQPANSALVELLPMLADDDPVVRVAALEAVGDLGREAPLAALTAALNDINPQVRLAAIDALALNEDAIVATSIEAIVYDRDPQVRVAAIDALAGIQARSSVPVLGGLLYDSDPATRMSALGALGDIGGARALRYLAPLRHDPDDEIRASARAILYEAGLKAFD